eukprot:TRINITY_DN33580_c0_g1_i1.p1 TRINITY_DN33580_c0_g1~~TRINITY_DN33580_c0_g1_i1.p1  ORF type:complete len:363 (+),score=60.66 TRINITY_DN33580_c0_g1_i1:53-1141(+)
MSIQIEVDLINTVVMLCGKKGEDKISVEEWVAARREEDEDANQVLSKVMRAREERKQGYVGVMKAMLAVTGNIEVKEDTPPAQHRPVTIEKLDNLFRRITAHDGITEAVKDGINHENDLVRCGVQLNNAKRSETSIMAVHRELDKLLDQPVQPSNPTIMEIWNESIPAELVPILVKWMVQLARTSALLSRVALQLFSRDSGRATEHEHQLADPTGLVVSTVKTPSTLSSRCNFVSRTWLGRPGWVESFAVLWQQLLYIFPSDQPNAACVQCILLRGCRMSTSSQLGKRNVVCLTDFLSHTMNAAHPQILIQFNENSEEWDSALKAAIAAPPTRETELILRAIRKQAEAELSQRLAADKVVND